MTARTATALLIGVAVSSLAGCGSGDVSTAGCVGGRTMTVTDPAGDGKREPGVVEDWAEAVTAKPAAFDVRRVTIATTDRLLCATVQFAEGGPKIESVPGTPDATLRSIRLELAPRRPRPADTQGPLGRLEYGINDNGALWVANGVAESDEELSGEQVSGVRKREVQLAVPLRELVGVNSTAAPGVRPIRFDPRSFSWRVAVASDCLPGPRQLIAFPAGDRIPLPAGTEADHSGDFC